jgi:hypothetical protein
VTGRRERRRKDTGNWKRKHYFAFCGELPLEDLLDLYQSRLRNEWIH